MKSRMLAFITSFVPLAASSHAFADNIVTFNLVGVTFADGGTATGSFNVDYTTSQITAVDIVTFHPTLPLPNDLTHFYLDAPSAPNTCFSNCFGFFNNDIAFSLLSSTHESFPELLLHFNFYDFTTLGLWPTLVWC
jgi:hypothetical protein